jgi:hypothetical protein
MSEFDQYSYDGSGFYILYFLATFIIGAITFLFKVPEKFIEKLHHIIAIPIYILTISSGELKTTWDYVSWLIIAYILAFFFAMIAVPGLMEGRNYIRKRRIKVEENSGQGAIEKVEECEPNCGNGNLGSNELANKQKKYVSDVTKSRVESGKTLKNQEFSTSVVERMKVLDVAILSASSFFGFYVAGKSDKIFSCFIYHANEVCFALNVMGFLEDFEEISDSELLRRIGFLGKDDVFNALQDAGLRHKAHFQGESIVSLKSAVKNGFSGNNFEDANSGVSVESKWPLNINM